MVRRSNRIQTNQLKLRTKNRMSDMRRSVNNNNSQWRHHQFRVERSLHSKLDEALQRRRKLLKARTRLVSLDYFHYYSKRLLSESLLRIRYRCQWRRRYVIYEIASTRYDHCSCFPSNVINRNFNHKRSFITTDYGVTRCDACCRFNIDRITYRHCRKADGTEVTVDDENSCWI